MTQRVYRWSRDIFETAYNPMPSAVTVYVGQNGPNGDAQSTLIRTILTTRFTADVVMGGSPSIPEQGLLNLGVYFTVNWNDEGASPHHVLPVNSDDPNYLGMTSHTPEITKHWTNANELLVNYRMESQLDVHAARVGNATDLVAPAVNVGLYIADPNAITGSSYASEINWSGYVVLETLWLNRLPVS